MNRTRLECKGNYGAPGKKREKIWIEPDWNVKGGGKLYRWGERCIWIEPDWNVKFYLCSISVIQVSIWIEPDWNVKLQKIISILTKLQFE